MSQKPLRAPIDTHAQLKKDPSPIGWLMGGAPEKILEQEAEGQTSLVHSDVLPTDYNGDGNAQKILEAAGVKFLGVVPNDKMFQYVELPRGWKKVPTDHSMWSDLVDDKGRKRASIFYKAAFYDRSAHMDVEYRFHIQRDYDRGEKEGIAVASVTDCDKVIHTTEPIKVNTKEPWRAHDRSRELAEKWLNEHYPDWESTGVYGD